MFEPKDKPLVRLSPEEVVRLCELNFIDYWRCMGDSPNAEFSESEGVTSCVTGVQQDIFNVVLRTELAIGEVDAVIDSTLNRFRTRKVPMIWYTGLLSTPRDIGRRLDTRGFLHDYDLAAMAVDLGSVKDEYEPPSNLVVKEVHSEEDSRKWIECLSTSWESPKQLVSWMTNNPCFNLTLKPKSGRELRRRLYLGLVGDQPVGTAMINWSSDSIGLQKIGTVHSARYKGVGTAVILHAIKDARALGFKTMVVLSTVEGVRLYERLGFKKFGKLAEHSIHFERT